MRADTREQQAEPVGVARRWPGGGISVETLILLGMLLVLVVIGAATSPDFFNAENARSIIRVASTVGIVAVGLTLVMLSGNFFSLSVEQTATVAATLFAIMLRDGYNSVLAAAVALVVGFLIGAVQGLAVAAGANPILVTLGVGAALAGFAGVISGGKGVPTGEAASWLAVAPLGIALPIWIFVLSTVAATVYLARARGGRSMMLIGSNRRAAVASGLSVRKASVSAFVLSALGATVVALLTVAQFNRSAGDQFGGLTFDALAAVLVAGTAIMGGDGSPVRTALAAILIATLGNIMVLHGFEYGTRLTILGVAVVLAVATFHLLRGRRSE